MRALFREGGSVCESSFCYPFDFFAEHSDFKNSFLLNDANVVMDIWLTERNHGKNASVGYMGREQLKGRRERSVGKLVCPHIDWLMLQAENS